MMIDQADRLKALPPYLFAELDALRAEALAQGVDVIDMGVGDPDLPTPQVLVQAMAEAVAKAEHHRYPPYRGTAAFRRAVAGYYQRRFGATLDPKSQALALLGAKEGIAHLCLALLNPGDLVLVPDPGYPVYVSGVVLAGAVPWPFRLDEREGYRPNLEALPEDVLQRARMVFLNYPNNPTGAQASLEDLARAAQVARDHDILLCHDAAYGEMVLEGPDSPSLMEVPGASDWAVEIGSLSKTFNMTGWRIGYAVGSERVLDALGRFKANVDSGTFGAIQEVAALGLEQHFDLSRQIAGVYRRRRDMLERALAAEGVTIDLPRATFYVWVAVGAGQSSDVAARILKDTGVVVTPGAGFGRGGEGHIRLSLTLPEERIEEAGRRLGAWMGRKAC